ncbi:MAG: hypothetical protein IKQ97_06410 [Eubacterium sp.]|nr:hypothetical protein [Eubacterium sp.]
METVYGFIIFYAIGFLGAELVARQVIGRIMWWLGCDFYLFDVKKRAGVCAVIALIFAIVFTYFGSQPLA